MGDRGPVHYDSFKSHNKSPETTISGNTVYLRAIYSLNICWDIKDVNQHSSSLRYM